ncbi:hypothetical protein HDV57DRAFT_127232 [Trichoderma longibrachiatum]
MPLLSSRPFFSSSSSAFFFLLPPPLPSLPDTLRPPTRASLRSVHQPSLFSPSSIAAPSIESSRRTPRSPFRLATTFVFLLLRLFSAFLHSSTSLAFHCRFSASSSPTYHEFGAPSPSDLSYQILCRRICSFTDFSGELLLSYVEGSSSIHPP